MCALLKSTTGRPANGETEITNCSHQQQTHLISSRPSSTELAILTATRTGHLIISINLQLHVRVCQLCSKHWYKRIFGVLVVVHTCSCLERAGMHFRLPTKRRQGEAKAREHTAQLSNSRVTKCVRLYWRVLNWWLRAQHFQALFNMIIIITVSGKSFIHVQQQQMVDVHLQTAAFGNISIPTPLLGLVSVNCWYTLNICHKVVRRVCVPCVCSFRNVRALKTLLHVYYICCYTHTPYTRTHNHYKIHTKFVATHLRTCSFVRNPTIAVMQRILMPLNK